MKVLHILWLILAGLFVGLIALITFPLLLLYVGVKIIGGFASKLNGTPKHLNDRHNLSLA